MRIIAGEFSGRVLRPPPGRHTRPTTSRVREAIFNLVEARMDLGGVNTMDLFAGSGALALEALSRGAAQVTLVEIHAKALSIARQNSMILGVENRCRFIRADVRAYLKRYRDDPANLILADPPYNLTYIHALPEIILKCLHPGGFLVIEHERRVGFEAHACLETTRTYGRTRVSLFKA